MGTMPEVSMLPNTPGLGIGDGLLLAVVKFTKNGDMEVYQAGHWAQV